jgi:hypothetical protein
LSKRPLMASRVDAILQKSTMDRMKQTRCLWIAKSIVFICRHPQSLSGTMYTPERSDNYSRARPCAQRCFHIPRSPHPPAITHRPVHCSATPPTVSTQPTDYKPTHEHNGRHSFPVGHLHVLILSVTPAQIFLPIKFNSSWIHML